MTTWTIEQLKQAGYNVSSAIIKPKNKYNNKVTHIGNLRFDSKKEYEYYLKLLSLKKGWSCKVFCDAKRFYITRGFYNRER